MYQLQRSIFIRSTCASKSAKDRTEDEVVYRVLQIVHYNRILAPNFTSGHLVEPFGMHFANCRPVITATIDGEPACFGVHREALQLEYSSISVIYPLRSIQAQEQQSQRPDEHR